MVFSRARGGSSRAAPFVLGAIALGALGIAALLPRIPQPKSYHRFADRRLLGIRNGMNTLSNLPFVFVGVRGFLRVLGRRGRLAELTPTERAAYLVFFGALGLTGLGSGYYHLKPNHGRLVVDRLPLTVTIEALVAAVIAERVGDRAGKAALPALCATGVASVGHWYATELQKKGDLRGYGLAQGVPILAYPVLLAMYEPRYSHGGGFVGALVFFGLARVCEILDKPIFWALGRTLNGHSLKHLFAAAAGEAILRMLEERHALPASASEREAEPVETVSPLDESVYGPL
ncbi:alkaline phytoceramidase [Polyangium aurulentum]|uniref:alkaline phytoceramidase n=1 Tax=Polyangium aurulentum TaxID=2567896 RepID=UPI0011360F39|nr:alkaline phytoceramidase [Polyangium aurulentum]UQA56828.1 ceramidase [Polyangium aurulentum]